MPYAISARQEHGQGLVGDRCGQDQYAEIANQCCQFAISRNYVSHIRVASGGWRATQNKTANSYVIEIAL